jgi:hypothetical protein
MSFLNKTATAEPTKNTTRTEQEKEVAIHISEFGDAPDGGLKAWLVAAGGSAIFFCCLGFSNSFGTFVEYYMTNQLQGESLDNIAWIGSV